MASNELKKNLVEKFLFKEKEDKLFVFGRDRTNPVPIREHIQNVKSFLKIFTEEDVDKQLLVAMFLRYFDDNLINEIKCEPGYTDKCLTIEYIEEYLLKHLETKTSRICHTMRILEISQIREEGIIDFAKRIRIACIPITENKEAIMLTILRNGLLNRRMENRSPQSYKLGKFRRSCGSHQIGKIANCSGRGALILYEEVRKKHNQNV